MMMENFLNMGKEIDIQAQETQSLKQEEAEVPHSMTYHN